MIGVLDRSDNEVEYGEGIWDLFGSGLGIQGVTGCKEGPRYLTMSRHFSWLHLFSFVTKRSTEFSRNDTYENVAYEVWVFPIKSLVSQNSWILMIVVLHSHQDADISPPASCNAA